MSGKGGRSAWDEKWLPDHDRLTEWKRLTPEALEALGIPADCVGGECDARSRETGKVERVTVFYRRQ